jgi:hypothetical protein
MEKKKISACYLLLFLIPSIAMSLELKAFKTDGCSSFPDGTINQQTLWLDCCILHDIEYWMGGTYKERILADQALEQCVTKVGESEIAKIMLAGVRVGGSAYFPTDYRWGYGWPYLRGYKALNREEKQAVKRKLEMLETTKKINIMRLH